MRSAAVRWAPRRPRATVRGSTRARLSADGQFYTCLFASRGQALRERIAEGEDALVAHLSGLWRARGDRYSEERAKAPADRKKIEMFYIGG